jgi:hypothetical protein|tara:strand:- start:259 stop:459 length:201 start_codon:yes stop_codon:yes gene_type:complete
MAKKLTLKQRLSNPILREGLFDSIFKLIQRGKLKAVDNDIKKLLLSKYGSWDKVPARNKRMFGMED